jgi:hypothetical protein
LHQNPEPESPSTSFGSDNIVRTSRFLQHVLRAYIHMNNVFIISIHTLNMDDVFNIETRALANGVHRKLDYMGSRILGEFTVSTNNHFAPTR